MVTTKSVFGNNHNGGNNNAANANQFQIDESIIVEENTIEGTIQDDLSSPEVVKQAISKISLVFYLKNGSKVFK